MYPHFVEPDNSFIEAVAIPTDGSSQPHNIFPAGDIDWVSFDAQAGVVYKINTTNLSPEMDTVLFLYDTNGITELVVNDDYGDYESLIFWTAPVSATYYVKIQHYYGFFGIGSYDISVKANPPGYFPDPNLESIIRQHLNKPTGNITASDLNTLTKVTASNKNIHDLRGLEFVENLQELTLDNNQIADISPLDSLTNLTSLTLFNNQISDISSLATLKNLNAILISSNQIRDISSLAGLTKLFFLDISDNQIRDISPLSSLINLSSLKINNNQLISIVPLVANYKNGGLGDRNRVTLQNNYLNLNLGSQASSDIQVLLQNGIVLEYQPQKTSPDIDGNGIVNLADLVLVAQNYSKRNDTGQWDGHLELVTDGVIDLYDLVMVARYTSSFVP